MKNKYFKYLCFGVFVAATTTGTAQVVSQKIGNNPTMISGSAILEVESTNKGVLIPRIALTSTTDATTINTPATSLFIFNTATAGTAPNEVTPGFYYWDGAAWIRMATGNALLSEVDGIIGNEIADAVADGGLTRLGTGTAADPYKLKLNDGTATGQILVWDGAKWVTQAAPVEVDGIIGNEVTDAVVDGGLTRTGAGTAADPYMLKINDGTANGQLLTWDGVKWIPQAATPDWALVGNAGTDPATNFIGTTDAQDLVLRTNNTEKMRVLSNGKVGIGTTTPQAALHVKEEVNNSDIIIESKQTSGSIGNASFTGYLTDDAGNQQVFGQVAITNFVTTNGAETGGIKLNTMLDGSNGTRVVLNGDKLGIRTSTPVSHLDVKGSIGYSTAATTANITLDATHAVVRVDATVGDVTITLPAAADATNRIYSIVKTDASTNKLVFSATINGNGYTFTEANVPGEYKIQSDGTSWNVLK